MAIPQSSQAICFSGSQFFSSVHFHSLLQFKHVTSGSAVRETRLKNALRAYTSPEENSPFPL